MITGRAPAYCEFTRPWQSTAALQRRIDEIKSLSILLQKPVDTVFDNLRSVALASPRIEMATGEGCNLLSKNGTAVDRFH